jgi:hypothetical protein
MSTLLVTFQTENAEHEAAVKAYLENFESMALSPTSRALDTDLSADELFREIENRLGPDDRVYVLTLGSRWIGYGYDATNDWLHRHLGPGPARCP